MDYLNNKWIDIKSKWNGLNKKAKIAIIGIAVVAIWWMIK
tara:strand:+ start:171 stop:290 length:120 start_codon:yes stop_codon:yes gene_type:complete